LSFLPPVAFIVGTMHNTCNSAVNGKMHMAKIMVGPKAYDYRWPSGSITAFPAGWTGTTKQAILDDAVAKGWGKDGTALANEGNGIEVPTK